MKTALVCGAGGFIGNHLVKRLKKEGYCIYTIGDCVEGRDALMATREGAELGREI